MTTSEYLDAIESLLQETEAAVDRKDEEAVNRGFEKIRDLTMAWEPEVVEAAPPVYTRLLTDEEMEVLKNGIEYDFTEDGEKVRIDFTEMDKAVEQERIRREEEGK